MELNFEAMMESLTTIIVERGLVALGALAVLVIGVWIAGRIRNGMQSGLQHTRLDPMLIPFTASLVYWGAMAFVLIAVLGIFGVPTASFIALLGAAGLAIGLALQGTLSNFASGVMILTFRPFGVGDWVQIAGESGTIAEVGLFSSALDTGDNVRVTIPNSQVYGQVIRNFSANDTRRIDLVIGVGYGDDLGTARETIVRVLAADSRVFSDPAPVVAVDALGDSSVNFVVRPWCQGSEYWDVRRDLVREIKLALDGAGCSIPFPQRDVHLHQVA